MRINTNVAALRTAYQLGRAEKSLNSSLAKLASGNKLTEIKDNPVGVSLSVKMKTQIRNLDRASQNTADGISIIETAEGALAEIQDMVQRINELAVQGANESYTDDDRAAIQKEVEQINQEIDRVSSDTDFNTKALLDGTLERCTYTNSADADVTFVSSSVEKGEYTFEYTDTASKASHTLTFTYPISSDQALDLNGATIRLAKGDDETAVYEKFVEAGDKVGIDVIKNAAGEITLTQSEYGSKYRVELNMTQELADELGCNKNVTVYGTDSTVTAVDTANSNFTGNTSWTIDGKTITFKDAGSFEIQVKIDEEVANGTTATYTLGITDVGPMVIQVGANEYQELDIEIPEVSADSLKLNKVRLYTAEGCGNAIETAQNAITRISEVRSKLGAYQNRMEHTIKTLDATEENMTESLSRIADVDMAEEMTTYTTYNVMSQAATSMLAQANQLPDKVLQLLQ